MNEVLQAVHAVADGISLVVTFVLAWAALFFVGPLLCAGVVLIRAAGATVPADAPLLFYGTGAAWLLAFAALWTLRVLRAGWTALRESTARDAARRGRADAEAARSRAAANVSGFAFSRGGTRTTGGRSPFSFRVKDPWVASLADQLAAMRRAQAAAAGRRTGRPSEPFPPRDGQGPRTPPPAAPPRAPEPEPHAVLGVPRGASADEIRKAYRNLVKRHHPDRVNDRSAAVRKAAHSKIIEIRRAYDALKSSHPKL